METVLHDLAILHHLPRPRRDLAGCIRPTVENLAYEESHAEQRSSVICLLQLPLSYRPRYSYLYRTVHVRVLSGLFCDCRFGHLQLSAVRVEGKKANG